MNGVESYMILYPWFLLIIWYPTVQVIFSQTGPFQECIQVFGLVFCETFPFHLTQKLSIESQGLTWIEGTKVKVT